jgi:hypothetical protein
MKKFILVFGTLVCFTWNAHAAPPVAEAPIKDYGIPVTVAISSTTITKIPTSQTSGRMGVFIDNPSTNTGNFVGFLGNCTSTALASTIRPFEISPGANSTYIPIREDVCIWLLDSSSAASSENVHYQEVIQ